MSVEIEKLDSQINSYFEDIKDKIEKIKSSQEQELANSVKLENSYINNTSNLNSIEQINNIINPPIQDIKISKDIFIESAESKFGLDNQFEFVKYNKNNYLLIHINNFNDLLLKLINEEENGITKTLIYKNIFPDFIREIRYYSQDLESKDNDKENKLITINYLLVSSQKNELKIYKVLNIDICNFENILEEINHITNIYLKPFDFISQDFFDLSSCAIRLIKSDLSESEIYTTCWEGNSIKIYNLYSNNFKTEITSKTSCNFKFCTIIEEKYLVFCGCNKQDNYTCANRIDLNSIDYSKEKNNNINFIKYRDENLENKENVHFNLYYYKNKEKKFLIISDEKGFLRLFNFDNKELIYKIYPSKNNIQFKYDESNYKIRRLNSIIEWYNNYFLITERNTGFVYIIKINLDKEIKLEVTNYFNLFNIELISIRKFINDDFLALGKDIPDKDLSPVEMIKKFKINDNE